MIIEVQIHSKSQFRRILLREPSKSQKTKRPVQRIGFDSTCSCHIHDNNEFQKTGYGQVR